MTREEQKQFVTQVTELTRDVILEKIDKNKVPEHWTGIELRQYIEDYIKYQINCHTMSIERKKNMTMIF